MAVLVNAWLAFFGVDQQDLASCLGVAGGLPLGADGEVRAAATAQTGVVDELPYRIAAHGLCFDQCLIRPSVERIHAANLPQQSQLAGRVPGLPVRGPPRSAAVGAPGWCLPAIAGAAHPGGTTGGASHSAAAGAVLDKGIGQRRRQLSSALCA